MAGILSTKLFHTLAIAVFAATTLTSVSGQSQCPAGMSNHLCCLSFGHFSDNYEVWENECGLDFPNSTTIGGACETFPGPCYSGLIALCCESTAECRISVDGILGVNCTEVED